MESIIYTTRAHCLLVLPLFLKTNKSPNPLPVLPSLLLELRKNLKDSLAVVLPA